jgi:hypothetical protein
VLKDRFQESSPSSLPARFGKNRHSEIQDAGDPLLHARLPDDAARIIEDPCCRRAARRDCVAKSLGTGADVNWGLCSNHAFLGDNSHDQRHRIHVLDPCIPDNHWRRACHIYARWTDQIKAPPAEGADAETKGFT